MERRELAHAGQGGHPEGGTAAHQQLIGSYDRVTVMTGGPPRTASHLADQQGWSAQMLVAGRHELKAQGQERLVLMQMIDPRLELWTDILGPRRAFAVAPGTIFVVPAGTASWWRHDHDGGLHLHMEFAADLLAGVAGAPVALEPSIGPPSRELDQLLPLLIAELRQPGQAHALYSQSLSQAICIALLRSSKEGAGRIGAHRGGLSGRNLRLVKDFISDNLAAPIDLSQLAALAGLSPHHFCRAFKHSTGRAPHAWLTACRIGKAQDLMRRQPAMGLIEIALSVGYESQSSFGAAFKRETGVAPGQWRRDRLG